MVIEEGKTYPISEMKTILSSNSKENIDKKLKRYNIDFQSNGRGNNCIYTINKIADPFKVFCIVELDCKGNTDFQKLRCFYDHYFNDEIFMQMPDKRKEEMMDKVGYHITRQTMAKYEQKLIDKNYIYPFGEYSYYFAYRSDFIPTDKETYCNAWKDFWEMVYSDSSWANAKIYIVANYGGMPAKRMKRELNAFTIKKVDELKNIIKESIENELDNCSN